MPDDQRAADDGEPLDITRFLDGVTHARGFFEDRFGRVRRAFDVTMIGRWDGPVFVLDEAFRYDNGEHERRTWRVTPGRDGSFSATCGECIGSAKGIATRGSWRMLYRFRLRMGRRSIAVSFDDRVHQVDAHLAINRAVVRKWGIRLGEVLIVFERQGVRAAQTATTFADAAE